MIRTILLLVLFLIAASAHSQCNDYYDFKNGSVWEMETYSAKGKLTGKINQTVTAFTPNSNGYAATVHSVVTDEKGKEVNSGDLAFTCEGGTMTIDMRSYLNEEQMKAFGNYKLTVESKNLEWPKSLSVGQTLKDGSVTVTAIDAPMAMTMTVDIVNRKVVAKETITTSAGTFECYKITSTMKSNMKMMVAVKMEFDAVEWIAPKVAVVKSESYKNGKLQGYTLLTAKK